MINRASFSGEEKSIDDILEWYNDQRDALRTYRNSITTSITTSSTLLNPKFIFFTIQQINDYFDDSEKELEHITCLNLVASTEAALKLDFYNKVYGRKRGDLTKAFRALYKRKEHKTSLDEDILATWKRLVNQDRALFEDLSSLLKYRHWLAHGRYWTLKAGRRVYSSLIVYSIVKKVLDVVNQHPI